MSILDKTLSAIKDILLLREQMTELRGDVGSLAGDVAGLVGDIRSLEQRLAKLEGYIEGASRTPFRPDTTPRIEG